MLTQLMYNLRSVFKNATTILMMIVVSSCSFFETSRADNSDPAVVSEIDLNKYAGKWFEIARYPTFFQRNCVTSTAEYAVQSPTSVSVYNVCYKEDGSTSDIKGTATVVDPAVPAKLKVRFNIFAQGQYWVVALDPNYQWAVVSSSSKSSLFILARTAPMNIELKNKIINDLKARGFETEKLIYDRY